MCIFYDAHVIFRERTHRVKNFTSRVMLRQMRQVQIKPQKKRYIMLLVFSRIYEYPHSSLSYRTDDTVRLHVCRRLACDGCWQCLLSEGFVISLDHIAQPWLISLGTFLVFLFGLLKHSPDLHIPVHSLVD